MGCWIIAIHVDKTRVNLATVMSEICGGKTNRLCVSLYTQVSNRRRRQPMTTRVESRDCGREGISNGEIWYDAPDLLTLLQAFMCREEFGSVEWVHHWKRPKIDDYKGLRISALLIRLFTFMLAFNFQLKHIGLRKESTMYKKAVIYLIIYVSMTTKTMETFLKNVTNES